jgi:hypothetical protein
MTAFCSNKIYLVFFARVVLFRPVPVRKFGNVNIIDLSQDGGTALVLGKDGSLVARGWSDKVWAVL